MKRGWWLACAALWSALPASGAQMDDVRAFLKAAEGSWTLSETGSGATRYRETRRQILKIKADGDNAWLVSYDDCNIPDPRDSVFGDCLGDRDRYTIMGLELRDERGELLSVASVSATNLVLQAGRPNGDVVETYYELLFGRALSRTTSRESNGVPIGAPDSVVLWR